MLKVFGGGSNFKDYDLGVQIGSAGPSCLWKVHAGVHKPTKEEVSLFVLEKKVIGDKHVSKNHQAALLEIMKHGPSQLQKLRHPNVLRVVCPLVETKDHLWFATEPVMASLVNLLGLTENLSPVPAHIRGFQFEELEIAMGLIDVSHALKFCHADAQLIHGSIGPECVFVTANGAWKLGGFHFSVAVKGQESVSAKEITEYETDSTNSPVRRALHPNLDTIAPECIFERIRTLLSDMYTLGHLIFSCFNNGSNMFEAHSNTSTYQSHLEKLHTYATSDKFNRIPESLQDAVRALLRVNGRERPTAEVFVTAQFFNSTPVLALRFLTSLFDKDEMKKSQFMKALPKTLGSVSKRVLHKRVLPILVEECRIPAMAPFVLPCVLIIGDDATATEFDTIIFPCLVPLFSMYDNVQIMQIFLYKMDLLLAKTNAAKMQEHVLPLVYKALESPSVTIQEMSVTVVPSFMNAMDYSTMKNSVIPRIQALILKSTRTSVIINGLVCLGKLLPVMDKYIMQESLLPMVEKVSSREPGVLMSILGIYDEAFRSKKFGFDKDFLSRRVIPTLLPLAIEPCLNLEQFGMYMSTVKNMVASIEAERLNQLQGTDAFNQQDLQSQEPFSASAAFGDTKLKMEDILHAEAVKTQTSTQPSLALAPVQTGAAKNPFFSSAGTTQTTLSVPAAPAPSTIDWGLSSSSTASKSATGSTTSTLAPMTLSVPAAPTASQAQMKRADNAFGSGDIFSVPAQQPKTVNSANLSATTTAPNPFSAPVATSAPAKTEAASKPDAPNWLMQSIQSHVQPAAPVASTNQLTATASASAPASSAPTAAGSSTQPAVAAQPARPPRPNPFNATSEPVAQPASLQPPPRPAVLTTAQPPPRPSPPKAPAASNEDFGDFAEFQSAPIGFQAPQPAKSQGLLQPTQPPTQPLLPSHSAPSTTLAAAPQTSFSTASASSNSQPFGSFQASAPAAAAQPAFAAFSAPQSAPAASASQFGSFSASQPGFASSSSTQPFGTLPNSQPFASFSAPQPASSQSFGSFQSSAPSTASPFGAQPAPSASSASFGAFQSSAPAPTGASSFGSQPAQSASASSFGSFQSGSAPVSTSAPQPSWGAFSDFQSAPQQPVKAAPAQPTPLQPAALQPQPLFAANFSNAAVLAPQTQPLAAQPSAGWGQPAAPGQQGRATTASMDELRALFG
eukprot:m.616157 g.616157  ORF g.616157 m.616157 type:complete len:1187 (-) comp58165_c0_seq2:95-3655(-)